MNDRIPPYDEDSLPPFDELELTVKNLAHVTIVTGNFHSGVLAALPKELAARVLTEATLVETTLAIDKVRFAVFDKLKAALGTDDQETLKRVVNKPETVADPAVQIMAQEIKFLAFLAQTVLHQ